MIGQKFNSLTVLRESNRKEHNKKRWICQCDCGMQSEVITSKLKNGTTKTCGCRIGNTPTPIQFLCEENQLILWANKIKERDKNICQRCGITQSRMIAHHIISKHVKESIFDLCNGITLCMMCHRRFHNRYPGYDHNHTHLQQFLSKEEKEQVV
jgi:5-methylcytosine-specific restriction endonuclease McrA